MRAVMVGFYGPLDTQSHLGRESSVRNVLDLVGLQTCKIFLTEVRRPILNVSGSISWAGARIKGERAG